MPEASLKKSTRVLMTPQMTIWTLVAFATNVPILENNDEPRTHIVEIKQFRFSSKMIRLRPGDTILWINLDLVPHTATAVDKSWDTGIIKKGESLKILVTRNFELRYFCQYHPTMRGKIQRRD